MEKAQENKENTSEKQKSLVWDCGSTLYDSFELNSFKRQLDSAISSRTMSMPHLPDRRAPAALPPQPRPTPSVPKKHSKISRSLHKLLRSMFKPKSNSGSVFRVQEQSKDGFYVVYDKSETLSTIPEAPEIDFHGLSPEIGSLVGRTTSARFKVTPTSIGISCA